MRTLNKKKVIIVSIIAILLVLIIGLLIFFSFRNKNEKETYETFKSYDNVFSIRVNKKLNLELQPENEAYKLILDSKKSNDSIYISCHNYTDLFDIQRLIESDKNNFISQFSNVANISDVTSLAKDDINYYTYSFNHSANQLVEVYWFQINDKFYIIDFNIDLNSENNMKDCISDILSSFKLLEGGN